MINNDSSRALERTLLNWQRTTLSMFVLSALCIKLSLLSQQQTPLLIITLIALVGSTTLLLLRFLTRPKYAQFVPAMLLASTIIVVVIGAIGTISITIN